MKPAQASRAVLRRTVNEYLVRCNRARAHQGINDIPDVVAGESHPAARRLLPRRPSARDAREGVDDTNAVKDAPILQVVDPDQLGQVVSDEVLLGRRQSGGGPRGGSTQAEKRQSLGVVSS